MGYANLQHFFASITDESIIRRVLMGLDGEDFHVLISNLDLEPEEIRDRWIDIYNTLVYQARV